MVVVPESGWNIEACAVYELARSAVWDVLAPHHVVPNVLCRTAAEHFTLKLAEPTWTSITDGSS